MHTFDLCAENAKESRVHLTLCPPQTEIRFQQIKHFKLLA